MSRGFKVSPKALNEKSNLIYHDDLAYFHHSLYIVHPHRQDPCKHHGFLFAPHSIINKTVRDYHYFSSLGKYHFLLGHKGLLIG